MKIHWLFRLLGLSAILCFCNAANARTVVKHRHSRNANLVQIECGDVYPGYPPIADPRGSAIGRLVYALRHRPKATRFRVTWSHQVGSFGYKGVVFYNRTQRILYYRGRGGAEEGIYDDVALYRFVTPQILGKMLSVGGQGFIGVGFFCLPHFGAQAVYFRSQVGKKVSHEFIFKERC